MADYIVGLIVLIGFLAAAVAGGFLLGLWYAGHALGKTLKTELIARRLTRAQVRRIAELHHG